MSHYIVVVIGVEERQLDAALAPFDQCTKNRALLEFEDIEDKYLERYTTESVEKIRLADGTLKWPWDDSFKQGGLFDSKTVYPPDSERISIAFSELYPDFETFMSGFASHDGRDTEKGRYGNWHNPQGIWDWYVVGGRWSGFFRNTPGAPHRYVPSRYDEPPAVGSSDLVHFGHWDRAGQMDAAAESAVRQYRRVYELLDGRPFPPLWADLLAEHNGNVLAAREAYQAHPTTVFVNSLWSDPVLREERVFSPFVDLTEEYACTLEQYVELARLRSVTPYAILKDGQWRARGRMGSFGISHDEMPELEWCQKVQGIYAELASETELIAVDCHI